MQNISKENPEKHKEMYDEMIRYFEEMGARFPKENPNYDPEKYREDKSTKERLRWGPFEGDRPLEEDEI